ncbi:MAG: KH domain-containing protein [Oscillospiraceae bacterium]|nr:KH domain-containing protein [Oscillospiraceae bacterium]
MTEAIGIGATMEDAVQAAIAQLNAPEGIEVSTEVLGIEKKLLKGTQVKVRAYYEETEFSKAEQYIKTVLRHMGVQESTVLTMEEDDGVRFSLQCGDDDGYVIGRRGETLDSLQYLVRLVISRGRDDYRRVSVNVADYRETREQNLRDLAIVNAGKAKKFGRNMLMPPMSAYDRRTVHTVIQEIEGVSSHSVGEGSDRRVVVAPDEQYRKADTRDNRRPGGGYNNRDRGGNMQRNQRNANTRRFPGDRNDRAPRQPIDKTPTRAPRSDVSNAGAGRYGKIEPRRADAEVKTEE